MNYRKHRLMASASAVSVALLAAGPCVAQALPAQATTANSPGADEIVVTARQRAETLTSVPVAASALSANDLIRGNANNITKIAEMVPQVSLARVSSGNGGSFTIRGIGSSPQDAGVEQSVSLALDGVQISRGRAVIANMFDLRQIEVLKGPQALFFGKNAPAGVLSINTALPTSTLSGFVNAAYEFEARERSIEAAISGPLTSTLKARLAVRASQMDGYIRNEAQPAATNPFNPFPIVGTASRRMPADKDIAGRLTVQWTPSSAITLTGRGAIGHGTGSGEGENREYYCSNASGKLTTTQVGITAVDPQSDCKINGRNASSDLNPTLAQNVSELNGGRQHNSYDADFGSLTADIGSGPIKLTSITAYLYLFSTGSYNCGGDSFAACFAYNSERVKDFSQQIRATTDFDSALNFTAGVYYDHINRINGGGSYTSYGGLDPVTGRYISVESRYFNTQSSYSGFGQVRWNIMSNLELAGGVRYTKEVKDARIGNIYVRPGPTSARAANDFISSHLSDDNWSPEATLTWHPQPGTTLYAAYKTGFLSGGIANPGTISRIYTPQNLRFKPETVEGGEIGAKGEFLNHKLRADLAVYTYTFKDLQVVQQDATLVPPSFITTNAARARSRGVEASMNWQATGDLSLRGAIGYNQSKYLDYSGANCFNGQTVAQGCVVGASGLKTQVLSGQTLYRAPKAVLNFGATYAFHLSDDLRLEATGDGIHSSSYLASENNNPSNRQDAYWRLNASLTLRSNAAGWSLALVGRNLTNERYKIYALDRTFGLPGEGVAIVGRSRELSLQARYSF